MAFCFIWICCPWMTALCPGMPKRRAISISMMVCSATDSALHPLLLHT